MALQPLDVVLSMHLALGGEGQSYAELASQLGVSPSQVHAALKRAALSGLVRVKDRSANRQALCEFLLHGLKYVFPAMRGPIVRGIPTAHSAEPLSDEIVSDGMPSVWPDSEGSVRGESLEPLHRSALAVAKSDSGRPLYHALTLVDALRAGRTRERRIAGKRLTEMLAG